MSVIPSETMTLEPGETLQVPKALLADHDYLVIRNAGKAKLAMSFLLTNRSIEENEDDNTTARTNH